jgi:hypothetical protein
MGLPRSTQNPGKAPRRKRVPMPFRPTQEDKPSHSPPSLIRGLSHASRLGYAFRHPVKPGMTGWAQVNALRGATPTLDLISRRVTLDLWYINNWSLWLDIQILIKTFFEVLRTRNAF